jgi:hypothetical protein
MKNTITLFILLISLFSHSQQLDWVKSTSYSQETKTVAMTVDDLGGIWHVIENSGVYYNTVIRKMNSNGDIIWSGEIGICKVVSIDHDSQGNIFILGSFWGGCFNVDFNPSPTITNNVSPNNAGASGCNTPIFILKLDNSGVFQFVKKIDGQGNDNIFYGYPQRIKVDHDDNVLLSFTKASGGFIDIDPSGNFLNMPWATFLILKWNNNCDQLVWFNSFGSGSQHPPIYEWDDNNVTPKTIIFDIDSRNQVYLAYRLTDSLGIIKLGADGVVLENSNTYFLDGMYADYIEDVEVINDNEILFAGEFISSVNLNVKNTSPYIINSLFPAPFANKMPSETFLVKYDSTFNVVWGRSPSPSNKMDFIEDIEYYDNKIYVCGTSDTTYYNGAQEICCFNVPANNYRNKKVDRSYLWIYDRDGNLISKSQDISPYQYGLAGDFYYPFPSPTFTGQNTPVMSNYNNWGQRKLKIHNGEIYIAGAFNTESITAGIYYVGGYENNFDWKRCEGGVTLIPVSELLKSFVSRYTFIDTAPTPIITDTVLNVCINSINNLFIQNAFDVGCDYEWHWFQNSCSGQPINIGSSYNFTASGPMDLYVRAVGSVSAGTCIHITVDVNTNPSFVVNNPSVLDEPFIVSVSNTTTDISNYSFEWIWGDGSNLFDNNVNVNHTYPNLSASYTIQLKSIQNNTNCQAISTCSNCFETGYASNQDLKSNRIYLMPNPAFNSINVYGLNNQDCKLQIFDLSGQKLSECDGQETDITNLAQGIYILRCTSMDVSREFRFIKM